MVGSVGKTAGHCCALLSAKVSLLMLPLRGVKSGSKVVRLLQTSKPTLIDSLGHLGAAQQAINTTLAFYRLIKSCYGLVLGR